MNEENPIMKKDNEILDKYKHWKEIENDADYERILCLANAGLMKIKQRINEHGSNKFFARSSGKKQ